MAAAIDRDAAVTVMRGPYAHAFLGLQEIEPGTCDLWSMWSAAARRRPLGLARLIRRDFRAWLDAFSGVRIVARCSAPHQQRFAEWLGMTRIIAGPPSVWTP